LISSDAQSLAWDDSCHVASLISHAWSLPRGGYLRGPESVAFDRESRGPYSGVSDGRVLKWNGDKIGWTTYAYGPDYSSEKCTASRLHPETVTESRCGRSLGLQFHHKSENLYIADAYKGLMRVGLGGGEATVWANEADGASLRFTNGVDVDQITGQVYFTDSSMNYRDAPRGRVYWPVQATTALDQRARPGKTEPFADLPRYPDKVRQDKRGGYWVALHREKNELPFGFDSHLLAVRVGPNEEVLEQMRGPKSVRPTEIMERGNGKYYMGSVELPYVGVVTHK
ncbi:hypothetical protein BRADI_1g57132v3, partial [Brachypodium distachyon]